MLEKLPADILNLMNLLYKNGKKPYLVGGCIRDLLMGISPHDYDITVCAMPQEVVDICKTASYKCFDVGKKFGTIGVLTENGIVEVTPYRTESDYVDFRHPGHVEFVKDVRLDLCRRDFTINAMAMGADGEILDCFGGRADLEGKVIRCVGVPTERFCEDALRIMRAVRFASRLGFRIDEETRLSMIECKHLLSNISAERINCELQGILTHKYAYETVKNCKEILMQVIPEFYCSEFLKENSGNFVLNLFACLPSADKVTLEKISERLKLSGKEKLKLLNLQEIYKSVNFSENGKIIFDDKVKRLFIKYPYEDIRDVFLFAGNDCADILNFKDNGVYRLQDLAINGKELIDMKLFPVSKTSKILACILDNVACEKLKNDKTSIVDFVKKLNSSDFE